MANGFNRVVILGARGMLGAELVREFGPTVIAAWDRDVDITNATIFTQRLEAENPDLVINAAAWTDVEAAEDHEEEVTQVNGVAVGNIAAFCAQKNIPFVHVSTSWVFDGTKGTPYKEDDQPRPLSAYGRSKLYGEEEVLKKCQKFYIVRGDRLYGANGKNIIDTFRRLGGEKNEINAVYDQIGSSVWTRDLARAMKSLVEDAAPYGIYHLVNEGSASWYDLAVEIISRTSSQARVLPVPGTAYPRKAKVPQNAALANTKRPVLRPWKEALADYLTKD